MHTFNGKTCIIHYDSELQGGEVHITDKLTNTEIKTDGRDILDFVAEYIRSKKIQQLEQAETKEILGI